MKTKKQTIKSIEAVWKKVSALYGDNNLSDYKAEIRDIETILKRLIKYTTP